MPTKIADIVKFIDCYTMIEIHIEELVTLKNDFLFNTIIKCGPAYNDQW